MDDVPYTFKLPNIDWLPINSFEPVVANELVALAKFSKKSKLASPSANVSGVPFTSLFINDIFYRNVVS